MIRLHGFCPECQKPTFSEVDETFQAKCGSCSAALIRHPTEDFLTKGHVTQCPLCGCTQLYRQKNFNRALGLGLVVVGAILAFFTYGISLLAVAVIDWVIYRRVSEVVCCYLCGTVIHGAPNTAEIAPFNLVLHDHYREVATKKLENENKQ